MAFPWTVVNRAIEHLSTVALHAHTHARPRSCDTATSTRTTPQKHLQSCINGPKLQARTFEASLFQGLELIYKVRQPGAERHGVAAFNHQGMLVSATNMTPNHLEHITPLHGTKKHVVMGQEEIMHSWLCHVKLFGYLYGKSKIVEPAVQAGHPDFSLNSPTIGRPDACRGVSCRILPSTLVP